MIQTEIKFQEIIWEILIDEQNDLVLLELRDAVKRQVSFVVLDLKGQKIILDPLVFEENWWLTAKYFDNDKIIFFKYKQGTIPEQEYFFVYDLLSQTKLWQTNLVLYDYLPSKNAVISPYQHPHIVSETGFEFRELHTGTHTHTQAHYEPELHSSWKQVMEYDKDSTHYDTILLFLEKNKISINIDSQTLVQYAENDALIAIGLQTQDLDYIIYVFSINGQLLESLIFEIQDIKNTLNTSQRFFLYKKLLIFLGNENKIINFAF
jgi:hypothetical protein